MLKYLNTPIDDHLLVIEGLDGSGKTYLAHESIRMIKDQTGIDVQYVKFPDPLNPHTEKAFNTDGYTSFLNMLTSNLQTYENQVYPLTSEGIYVLTDRFKYSNVSYSVVNMLKKDLIKPEDVEPVIEKMSTSVSILPSPTSLFMIYADLDTRTERLHQKDLSELKREDEYTKEYPDMMFSMMKEMSTKSGNIPARVNILDNSRFLENISLEILVEMLKKIVTH